MRSRFRFPRLALLSLGLLGCGSSDDAESLFRRGNKAFARGDTEAAVALWQASAGTDPGAAAFNLGMASLAKREFRDAERRFRCAEADDAASPQRRAAASHHRGTALLMVSGGSPELLTAADCLRRSLESRQLSDEMAADARQNLELVKERLHELAKRPPTEPPPQAAEGPPPITPPNSEPLPATPTAGPKPASTSPDIGPTSQERTGESPPRPSDRTAPGGGNLPVLPDVDRPPSITPAEGRAWLDRITQRLKRDRIRQAELLAGPERKQIRDW